MSAITVKIGSDSLFIAIATAGIAKTGSAAARWLRVAPFVLRYATGRVKSEVCHDDPAFVSMQVRRRSGPF